MLLEAQSNGTRPFSDTDRKEQRRTEKLVRRTNQQAAYDAWRKQKREEKVSERAAAAAERKAVRLRQKCEVAEARQAAREVAAMRKAAKDAIRRKLKLSANDRIAQKLSALLATVPVLPISPEPKPGECITGFLFRVASANAIPTIHQLKEVAKALGSEEVYSKAHCGRLAKLVGVSEKRLYQMGPTPSRLVNLVNLVGYDVPLSLLNRKHRRVCPTCLAEDPFIRGIWGLKVVRVCFQHNVRLVTRCHECHTALRFSGPNLAFCGRCAADLRQAPVQAVAPAQMTAAKLLLDTISPKADSFTPPAELQGWGRAQVGRALAISAAMYARVEGLNVDTTQAGRLLLASANDSDSPDFEKALAGGLELLTGPSEASKVKLACPETVKAIQEHSSALRELYECGRVTNYPWPPLHTIIDKVYRPFPHPMN